MLASVLSNKPSLSESVPSFTVYTERVPGPEVTPAGVPPELFDDVVFDEGEFGPPYAERRAQQPEPFTLFERPRQAGVIPALFSSSSLSPPSRIARNDTSPIGRSGADTQSPVSASQRNRSV